MAEAASDPSDPLEAAVEQAIAICDGDVHATLRATLVANSFWAAMIEFSPPAATMTAMRRRTRSSASGLNVPGRRRLTEIRS